MIEIGKTICIWDHDGADPLVSSGIEIFNTGQECIDFIEWKSRSYPSTDFEVYQGCELANVKKIQVVTKVELEKCRN